MAQPTMTAAQEDLRQRRPWVAIAVCGTVIAIMGLAFWLLEQQRNTERVGKTIRVSESVDGDVVAASFLESQVTARQLNHLCRYPELRRLDFAGTNALRGRLRTLQSLPELRTIILSNVGWLDETVMSDIAGLPQIHRLLLGESSVTDSLLNPLAAHPGLKTLSLRGCRAVSDQSLGTILSLPALEQLDLIGTGVSLEGFVRLRTARPELTIGFLPAPEETPVRLIGTLRPSANEQATRGEIDSSAPAADLVSLLSIPHDWWTGKWVADGSLKSVRSITLTGPSAAESVAWLAPRLSQLNAIKIPASGLSELTAAQVAEVDRAVIADVTSAEQLLYLASMPLMRDLALEITAPLESDFPPPDFELPQLTTLAVRGAGVQDATVGFLKAIAAPTSLELELPTPLSPETLQDLAGWRQAEYVTLRGSGVDMELITALSQLSDLTALNLEIDVPSEAALHPEGSETLPVPYLRLKGAGVNDALVQSSARTTAPASLYLALETPLSSSILQDLQGWRQIMHISLRGPGVSRPLIEALAQLTELESLDLEVPAPLHASALEPLSGLAKLANIALQGPGVDDALVTSLAAWSSLAVVTVGDAPVTDAGMAPFLSLPTPPEIRAYRTRMSPQMLQHLRDARGRR
jgi:hypothetical protein